MVKMVFDSINVGDTRESTHQLTTEDVQKFADLSGDYGTARKLSLKGMREFGLFSIFIMLLTASFFSKTVLTFIPRFYNKYLRQKVRLQVSGQSHNACFIGSV